ncbi:MAG: hypothetical protein ACOX68_02715 [Candidatus Limivicinus sp.]
MKFRRLFAVILALGIVAGIIYFAKTNTDSRRGTISLWCTAEMSAASELEEAVEDYNGSFQRDSLPVELVEFSDEEALADAFEKQEPDLLFCSHFRALELWDEGRLSDIGKELGPESPGYPKSVTSRSDAVGHGFFPVGSDIQLLVCGEDIDLGEAAADFRALCTAASEYSIENGRKPFFAADSFARLFCTQFLRQGEEFAPPVTRGGAHDAMEELYNAIALAAYDGALADCAGDCGEYVVSGALPCAVLSSAKLADLEGRLQIFPLPPMHSQDSRDNAGEMRGFAVTAGGCRNENEIAKFVSWILDSNRGSKLALKAGLVPAQECSLITRDRLWTVLLEISRDSIVSLPLPDSACILGQEEFESSFREDMSRLAG